MATPALGSPKPSRLEIGCTGLAQRTHRRVLAFRRAVETLYAEAHGHVDALAAKRIASAVVALNEAERARTRLADAAAGKITLSEEAVMAWSDRYVRNHQAVDRILAGLGIDPKSKAESIWDSICAKPLPVPVLPAPPERAPAAPPATTSAAGDSDAAPREHMNKRFSGRRPTPDGGSHLCERE